MFNFLIKFLSLEKLYFTIEVVCHLMRQFVPNKLLK